MSTTTHRSVVMDRFEDAAAALWNIKSIHTDLNIATIRSEMINGTGDDAVSADVVWALEVFCIAKAVAARFDGTRYSSGASFAIADAYMFYARINKWFNLRRASPTGLTSGPVLDHGNKQYRALLLEELDWIPTSSTSDDSAPFSISTSMSPITAYLQFILISTPMEHWIAISLDPNSSPLGFALAWAREAQRQTADVVALVTMGCTAHRNMVYAAAEAEDEKLAASGCAMTCMTEGLWASLELVASRFFKGAIQSIRSGAPSSRSDHYELVDELNSQELLSTLRHAAEQLGEAGEQYAQLLDAEAADLGRVETVVASIRSWTELILAKAEPPASEAVLRTIPELAKTA